MDSAELLKTEISLKTLCFYQPFKSESVIMRVIKEKDEQDYGKCADCCF